MHRLLAAALLSSFALPAAAEVYLSRCKMEECVYYDQTNRQMVGEGSTAVPGKLVSVRLRAAATYGAPQPPAAALEWDAPATIRFFCSTARPAYEEGEGSGSFQVINLAEPSGPREMVSVMYLHACHPEAARESNDTGATLRQLGYGAVAERSYPSFKALIRK